MKVLEAQGLSKKRIYKYVSHLKLVSKHVKVPFKSVTRDAKLGFTEAQLYLKYGWKIGSRVPSVYLHLSAKDLRDVVRNIYGKKPLDPPKPQTIECPKCHALNNSSQNYCSNYGSPLNPQEIVQKSVSVEELKYRIDKLTEIILKLLSEKGSS